MEAWYRPSNGLCHNAFLFCLFSHKVANICVADDNVFAYQRKIEKVVFQMLKKFSKTLNVSQESSTYISLHGPFFTHRTLVGKVFTEVLPDSPISCLQTLPPALSHFYTFISIFWRYCLRISYCNLLFIPLSKSASPRDCLALWQTVVIITSHSFKNSVARIANSIYTETVHFLWSTTIEIALSSTAQDKAD